MLLLGHNSGIKWRDYVPILVGRSHHPPFKYPLRVPLLLRVILHVAVSTSLFIDFAMETGKYLPNLAFVFLSYPKKHLLDLTG
jgi:hypothetical protein